MKSPCAMNGQQCIAVDRPLADDLPPAFDSGDRPSFSRMARRCARDLGMSRNTRPGRSSQRGRRAGSHLDAGRVPWPAARAGRIGHRYSGVSWGRDDFAIVYSRWYNTRNEKRFAVNPSRPGRAPAARAQLSGSLQQSWLSDPPPTSAGKRHPFHPMGPRLFATGPGASRAGVSVPRSWSLADGTATRLWQAQAPYYESLVALLDGAEHLLTRRESETEAPNYYVRTREDAGAPIAISRSPRNLLMCARSSSPTSAPTGWNSAALYLPPGTIQRAMGRCRPCFGPIPQNSPMRVASQVVDRANRFVRPGGSAICSCSHRAMRSSTIPRCQSSARTGPSRTYYVEQLSAGAEAAVNARWRAGWPIGAVSPLAGTPTAFMTANLLAHTDLFRAGIARSGAYNHANAVRLSG